MKAVVQRCSSASVRIDGETVGSIERGMVVLLGVMATDDEAEADRLAAKIAALRIFPSERRPIDSSVTDVGGSALVISQFTLCADTSRGNRPSFVQAAEPEKAERLYERFCESLRSASVPVETGRFAAMMDVELVNDGPVTIVLP
ncbi:MAG: D-aminoacyl-tRNA deacylase [Planctomycetota bacterium]|nr:D-aminoacyl-tRNA deacylase [Planctomycetota bacterium]